MADNTVMDALRARFCKNTIPSTQEPKKSLLDLKYALEAHFDEEDEKARLLWTNEIKKEASIFYNLAECSALTLLQSINRNLERKYDEGMARMHIDPDEALAEYEELVKMFQRDDLVDILEKYGRMVA